MNVAQFKEQEVFDHVWQGLDGLFRHKVERLEWMQIGIEVFRTNNNG